MIKANFISQEYLARRGKKPDAKKLYNLELMSTAYITFWKKEKWIALAVSALGKYHIPASLRFLLEYVTEGYEGFIVKPF